MSLLGLGGGGGSVSNNTSTSINPVFSLNVGDGNTSKSSTSSISDQKSSADKKDEFGLSASAGVAVGGGQAQGGTASLARSGDDVQPIAQRGYRDAPPQNGLNPTYLAVGAGFVGLLAVAYALKKK